MRRNPKPHETHGFVVHMHSRLIMACMRQGVSLVTMKPFIWQCQNVRLEACPPVGCYCPLVGRYFPPAGCYWPSVGCYCPPAGCSWPPVGCYSIEDTSKVPIQMVEALYFSTPYSRLHSGRPPGTFCIALWRRTCPCRTDGQGAVLPDHRISRAQVHAVETPGARLAHRQQARPRVH